jgi:hypothetical protein
MSSPSRDLNENNDKANNTQQDNLGNGYGNEYLVLSAPTPEPITPPPQPDVETVASPAAEYEAPVPNVVQGNSGAEPDIPQGANKEQ